MLDSNIALETSVLATSTQPATDFSNLWLEWQVANGAEELVSFDFNLVVKEPSSLDAQKVSVPFLALIHLAEKYSWLQVLRGPEHIPQDPYELVRFIKTLENSQR
jgi:hypothetical protein